MFCYNDAWFMNNSLALYTSTNTFSNPLFDDRFHEGDDNSSQQSIANELRASGPDAKRPEEEEKLGGEEETEEQEVGYSQEPAESIKASKRRYFAFCDSFMFAAKSKIFVLELNFRRELQRFRRFASKRLPSLLFGENSRIAGKESSHFKRQFGSWSSAGPTTVSPSCGGHFHQQQWSKLDKGFWKNIEPDSRETLSLQEEKILYRLERILQATRREQQQQQGQLSNLDKPDLQQANLDRPPKGFILDNSSTSTAKESTTETTPLPSLALSAAAATTKSSQQLYNYCNKVQFGKANNARQPQQQGRTGWIADARSKTADVGQHHSADSTQSKKLCIVCYSNPPNIVTLPCKHHDICSDCFLEIIYMAVKHSKYPLKCVLCRQKVERIGCLKSLI